MTRFTTAVGMLAATAALALTPSIASAAGNGGIDTAAGPLAAGTDIADSTSANGEHDWYLVYASGSGNLEVEIDNTYDTSGCRIYGVLRDADGEELRSFSVDDPNKGAVVRGSIGYATPGAGAYYVDVASSGYSCAGNAYKLRVRGPVGSGPAVGRPDPTPNASRDATTAFGPLAGDKLYGGRTDANGEHDWFVMYTAGGGSIDVALTNPADASGCNVWVTLRDETGTELASDTAHEDRVLHIGYTAPRATKLLVDVWSSGYSCAGNTYQFTVSPASMLTGTPAPPMDTDRDGIPDVSDKCPAKFGIRDGCQPPPSAACTSSRSAVFTLTAQLPKLRSAVTAARNKKTTATNALRKAGRNAKKRDTAAKALRKATKALTTANTALSDGKTALSNAQTRVGRSC
jgi:hypothetical protein